MCKVVSNGLIITCYKVCISQVACEIICFDQMFSHMG